MTRVRLKTPSLSLHRQVAHTTKRVLRTFRENLELATLLAFVAGDVNSVAFLHFGTYVSHVSGHATRAAVEYAEGATTSALLFFFEFLAFILGAATTAFILKGRTAASSQVKYTLPIFLELLLILAFMVGSAMNVQRLVTMSYYSHLPFLLAIAMGVQNAMFRQASGTIVRTTHMTGVATDLGVELGAAVRTAGAALLDSHLSFPSRIPQALQVFIERLGVNRFFFHGFILFSFSAGAVVGTVSYLLYQDYALVVPVIILLVIGCREFFRQPEPDSLTANISESNEAGSHARKK